MRLDEIVSCVAMAGIEEEGNENVTTILNMFAQHAVEVLADMMKERL